MARIILATYMVRYPLGGMLSWALQWAIGFKRLGHEVLVVERAHYPDACFNPAQNRMMDDGEYGFRIVSDLLQRFGLVDRLVFVDWSDFHYGLSKAGLEEEFRRADLLIDMGNHGAWQEIAWAAGIPTVLVDGEPGYTQIKMVNALAQGHSIQRFDHYFTNGANIGTQQCIAPDAGVTWKHVFNPVVTDIFAVGTTAENGAFSTVMNWQSHPPIVYQDREFGQKDIEFEKFLDLPSRIDASIEIAAAGKIPREKLLQHGWAVKNAHEVTATFDAYRSFISGSRGEFSVCKNIFVDTGSGWFSDRSAAYLASGRPVVLQDTGFSAHLPCGRGLFAVNSVEEAAAAISEIGKDYVYHCQQARQLAQDYLEATRVLGKLLTEIGVQGTGRT